jgi:carboxylesterase type B
MQNWPMHHLVQLKAKTICFSMFTVSQTTFKQDGAPVLVWIHGDGYIMNKAEGGGPIGILERSAEHTERAVFVAIAYRVCFSH